MQRNPYIDFLRALGLLLLVVAHTSAPFWLRTLRIFDVPLMVVISGMCANVLRGGYLAYFIKRLKRIYIPVCVFLCIFFMGCIVYSPLGSGVFFPMKTVVGSFLLLNEPSIGYVWIMRIFLLIALVMPLLQRISQRLSFKWFTMLVYSMVLVQSILIYAIGGIEAHKLHLVVDQTVLYVFGYSIFALIGINISKFKRWQVLGLTLLSIVSIVVYFWYKGGFVEPKFYKYPPSQIYLLYGMSASFMLWFVQPWIPRQIVESKVCRYLSENSMWIYLWHIIPLYYITDKMTTAGWLPWLWRFCIVLVISLLLNVVWHKIVAFLPKRINKYIS